MPDDSILNWIKKGIESGYIKSSYNVPVYEKYREELWPDVFIDLEGKPGKKGPSSRLPLSGGGIQGQKKIIKKLQEDYADVAPSLLGQKIYFLDKKNLIQIRGEPAYVLEFIDKKDDKSITVAIKDDNGVPRKITYNLKDVADDIEPLRRSRLEESLSSINETIQAHNRSIEKMSDKGGVQTLPLRFASLNTLIDNRLSVLEEQKDHFQNMISEFSETPLLREMGEFGISELGETSSEFLGNRKDYADLLLHYYSGNEGELISKIDSGALSQVPAPALAQVRAYAESILQKKEKDIETRRRREETRLHDIEDLEQEVGLPDQPLPELSIEDLPLYTPEKATGYKSDVARRHQAEITLKSVTNDYDELKNIKEASVGLQEFISGLKSKGEYVGNLSQLSREYLSSPESQYDVNQMKEFRDAAKAFFRRYRTNVWDENGVPDKAKLGRVFGGRSKDVMANFFIALGLKQVTTAFDVILKSYAGQNY